MGTVGIVLAAGASTRMGMPKALLRDSDGRVLAARQAQVLLEGGCVCVAVVLGAGAAEIRQHLPKDLPVLENPLWARGRATSLQAAIAAFPRAAGFLFLPVDAVGVVPETVQALLAAAAAGGTVWRPLHKGRKGNLLWISNEAAADLRTLSPAARIDEWAQQKAHPLEVRDPAIVVNINTRAEWETQKKRGAGTVPSPRNG